MWSIMYFLSNRGFFKKRSILGAGVKIFVGFLGVCFMGPILIIFLHKSAFVYGKYLFQGYHVEVCILTFS